VRRFHGDDPLPLPPRPAEELPLWGWPEAPQEESEQKVLRLEPSTEDRWLKWSASDEGRRFIEAVKVRAMAQALMGAPLVRVKAIIEEVRGALHLSVDNRFQSYISRELSRETVLAPLIERRMKRAI
jgi:hypothetical protein